MGEKGKCGATVRQAVMQAVFQPCISPPLGGEVKNFLSKKNKKNIKKNALFPLTKPLFILYL
jgi:signal-transduction protein with cAMP-binding, CBS, and nucleotidyltransferase domain